MDIESQTYQNGTQKYKANGLNALVDIAVKIFGDLNHTKNDSEIIILIATEIASLKTKNIGLNVENVERDLETLNATVSSVLQNVLIGLITEQNKNELNTLVKFAEKLLQLSLAENQNIVEETVWQKLSPNLDLFTLARKPLSEKTVAQNVLKHGTGGINIDGCRVGTTDKIQCQSGHKGQPFESREHKFTPREYQLQGRFPANLIHDGSDEVVGLFPNTTTHGVKTPYDNGASKGINLGGGQVTPYETTSGSASRFFYCAKASKAERNKGLEGFENKQTVGGGGGIGDYKDDVNSMSGKYGSEKALSKNNHPTIKPISLMRYLCRLITPKGGAVLDCFTGSGSTGVACKLEGFDFIGIEREEEYVKIAEARIKAWKKESTQGVLNI